MSLGIGLSIGIDRSFANAPGYMGPGVIAFDSAAGWTTGQNPPAISITFPNDGTIQVGDWYRIEHATNSSFTGSSFGSWYQITSNDILNNGAVSTTYPWDVNPLPAGATWFRQYFGRGPNAGAITVQSVASNVITDTLNAASRAFTASTTQPAAINNAYGSATYTFSAIDFVGGGYGAVWIAWSDNSRTISSVTIKGAGPSGADIALVNRQAAFGQASMWACPDATQIAASGNYNVVVVTSTVSAWIGIMCGTLTNATTTVPTGTATFNGSVANPVTTTSALAISSTGVGAAFFSTSAPPPTAANGTQLAVGMSGFNGVAGNNGCLSKQVTPGSWTASFNEGSQNVSTILAAMFG